MYLYGQYCPVARASEILADRSAVAAAALGIRAPLGGGRHDRTV
jgi:hypothetical protein